MRTRWIGMALLGAAVFAGWWSTRPEPSHQVAEPEPVADPPAPALAPAAPPTRAQDAAVPPTPRAADDSPAANSPAALAPGQALREVRALVDQQKIGAARALAERYLNEIPRGEEAAQIMSLTGVHPHP